ncbi:MAG: hypothetical protein AB1767_12530 [Bacillota bacterium]
MFYASRLGIYDGSIVNLDFHTVPHFGDESVLDEHWAGARGKRMKGALTLFAQDAQSKLILYTAADIQRREADDENGIAEAVKFAHNPILRAVPWQHLPSRLPWLGGTGLTLQFK